jgi:hypothetical protein
VFRALLLATTASLAAGVLTAPGAAWADDTVTSLTSAEMSAALKGVAGTTAPAELTGFGGDFQLSVELDDIKGDGTAKFATDPAHGSGYLTASGSAFGIGSGFGLAGKGAWQSLGSAAERAAAKMAGHPTAKYVFQADPKLTLHSWARDNLPVPSELVAADSGHSGTKSVHDDGTTAYTFATDDKLTITFTADAAGVLTTATATGTGLDESFAWNYGEQTVTLPTGAQTIARATLDRAVAYLSMAAKVKDAATVSAKVTQSRSHGRTVKVANLRKWTRSEVAALNGSFGVKVLAVTDIKGGVRISAKNPFTGEKAAYTVKASGKRAVARKA